MLPTLTTHNDIDDYDDDDEDGEDAVCALVFVHACERMCACSICALCVCKGV